MDEVLARILEMIFIFLGIALRTGAPAIRKLKKLEDLFNFDITWIGTAVVAFFGSWYMIIMVIPADFDLIGRLFMAFGIAFFGNSLVNELVKWEPLNNYIFKGQMPPQ